MHWDLGANVCDKGLQFAASSHENRMHAKEMVSNIPLVEQAVPDRWMPFKYSITSITV